MKALTNVLFPDPDAIFVHGPDNASYWIMLFVKSEFIVSARIVYYFGYVVEIVFLLCGVYFHGKSTFLIWKHKVLHPNMILIFNNLYFTFHIGSIARIGLIIFESRLVRLHYLGSFPVPQLAIVRMFSIAQAFGYIYFATVERIFATSLVDDYEKNPRYRNAVFTVLFMDVVVLLVSIILVAGVINGYLTCILAALPSIGCLGVLQHLLKRNMQRMRKLSDTLKRSANDGYSLSLRTQLRENVWTLQKIEFGMFVVVVALAVNLSFFLIPVSILTEPEQMEKLQWCQWATNISIAISITCGVPIGTFALAMHSGKLPSYARWYLRIFGRNQVITVKKDSNGTDEHFHQLHSQWDLAIRRASSDHIVALKQLYYAGVVVEVLFLLCGVYLHGHSTYMIVKHKALHPNMILIYTNYYVMFNIGSIARIGLILFETRLIYVKHLGSFPVPYFGIIRMYSVIHIFCYLYFSTLERVVATILAADYERHQRHRFAITIIIFLNAVILAVSSILVTGVVNGYICCFIAFPPCVGCLGVLRFLLRMNRKTLAKLAHTLKRSANDHYSLSLRLQLRENVWSIQKIEFGMYIVVFSLLFNLGMIFIPIFVLDQPDEMEALQWWQWTANLLIAVCITCSVPMGTFAVAMHTGNLPVYARWYLKLFGQEEVIVVKSEKKETDEHFHQLHNQWDLAMRRKSRWR